MPNSDFNIGGIYYIHGFTKARVIDDVTEDNKYNYDCILKVLDPDYVNENNLIFGRYDFLKHERKEDYKVTKYPKKQHERDKINAENDNVKLDDTGKYYFIAGFLNDLPGEMFTDFMGFYTDLETARSSVKENTLDINEAGAYPFVVIEQIEHEGLYPCPMKREFYKFNRELDEYEPYPEPEQFHGWYGFTL